jgi:Fe-S-cluster containining protein
VRREVERAERGGAELDCRLCGACCFSPLERYVRLSGEDHARLRPDERARLTFFHGNRCYMLMQEGHCAALAVEGGRYVCTVYERRPQLCRDYERGGPACDHDRSLRGAGTALADPARVGP